MKYFRAHVLRYKSDQVFCVIFLSQNQMLCITRLNSLPALIKAIDKKT